MSNSLAGGSRTGGPGPTRQQLDELDALLQRMLDLPVTKADEPAPEPGPAVPVPAAPRPARSPAPAPEPDLPPVRYYEPDDLDDEDDLPAVPRPAAAPRPIGPRVMKLDAPVPGGRHDLEEDAPVDPAEELARIRAAMQQAADRQAAEAAAPGLPPSANIANAPSVAQGEWVPLRSSWQPSAQTWKPLADRWEQSAQPETDAAPPPIFPRRKAPSGPVVLTQTSSEAQPPVLAPRSAPAPAPQPQPAAQDSESPPEGPSGPLVWFNKGFDVLLLPWCPRGKLLRGPSGRKLLGAVGVMCLLAAAALAVADGLGWTW